MYYGYYGYEYDLIYGIVCLIVLPIMAIVFGCITKNINEKKGYYGGFAWGFWLGWIGIIVVACKPPYQSPVTENRYGASVVTSFTGSSGRYIATGSNWMCRCGTENSERLEYCTICRRSRSEGEIRDMKCPYCGAYNRYDREYCVACNRALKQQPALTAAPAATPAAPVATPAAPAATSAGMGAMEGLQVLEKLAQLHSDGILSDEEYAEKKKDILTKI